MFICLNQSLYDTQSNISCDNGKLKVRRQINSEVITQLYMGIITFTMGRVAPKGVFFIKQLITFSHPGT